MVKHTPAPWSINRYDMPLSGGKLTIKGPYSRDESGQSWAVNVADVHNTRGNAEANARLIAAAPELLAAVLSARRAFLNILDMGLMPSKEYDPDTRKLVDQMHEAIVKATGSAMPGK